MSNFKKQKDNIKVSIESMIEKLSEDDEQQINMKTNDRLNINQSPYSQQHNIDQQFIITQRCRQFSVQNRNSKRFIEFPTIYEKKCITHNFYNDKLSKEQNQTQITDTQQNIMFRDQRSTSLIEGSDFYSKQSKTCNISIKTNQSNEIQNKFFRYFKTQGRMRKDSLKQFSEIHSENQSLSSKSPYNDIENKNGFFANLDCQNSTVDDEINDNNSNIEINRNYLYEEALDTIQDDDQNRQDYFELYKKGNKNINSTRIKSNSQTTKNNSKIKQQCELIFQGDLSPWHKDTNSLRQSQSKRKEQRSLSVSTNNQIQKNTFILNKDNEKQVNNQKNLNTTQFKVSIMVGGFGSESKNINSPQQISAIPVKEINTIFPNEINKEESKLNCNNYVDHINEQSSFIFDPLQSIQRMNQSNNRKVFSKQQQEKQFKETYNFSFRNIKSFKNNTRYQLKPISSILTSLDESNSKQFDHSTSEKQSEIESIQNNQIQNTPNNDQNSQTIVEVNSQSGKENSIPKIYSNLTNSEAKRSLLPKIQNQLNPYKPNTIIFQSNQKYKSQYDNSSNNFNECITFLPKDLKNKMLKQLEK